MISNQFLLAALLALGVTACCVVNKKTPPRETADRRQVIVEEAPLGLSVIEPTSDVAKLTKAVRHVLFPDTSLASVSMKRPAPTPRKERPQAPPIEGTTPSLSSEPYAQLWQRYCEGKSLTMQEWNYIDTHPLPNEWIDQCRPIK